MAPSRCSEKGSVEVPVSAWPLILSCNLLCYSVFLAWWRWGLPRALAKLENPGLDEFHRAVSHPFGLFYISNFLLHLAIAWSVRNPWTSLLGQFFIYGVLPIASCYLLQLALVYPWHKRLAGTTASSFLRSVLAYLRLTAALLAPFFIYQLLNTTLFDAPTGRIDAVEVVVFNVGRVVVLSLLTIVCSVIFMLKMIPNSRVEDDEYLGIIQKRLTQAGWSDCRLRWIDIPDFNNAFVVGFRWFGFSNQTMFIGRSLRELLTKDEFDAVISHELGHMANGHLLKRITYAFLLIAGLVISIVTSLTLSILITLAVSDDPHKTTVVFSGSLLVTLVGSYLALVTWLFRKYRNQEHEADAFAVMKLGIRIEDLENSLRKVTKKFRDEARRRAGWNPFTTHPEIETRIENVRTKITRGVSYDWNQSPVSRLLEITIRAASPRTLALSFTALVLTGLLTHTSVQQNRSYLAMVERGDVEGLQKVQWHAGLVNARQYILFGVTPLEMAVHRSDLAMVKFLISKGADPARGSGFNSPVDVAMARAKWAELDYLLGQLPDSWLEGNVPRLFALAAREESGQALSILLNHRLQSWMKPEEMNRLVDRIAGQKSQAKILALQKAGISVDASRAPASAKP